MQTEASVTLQFSLHSLGVRKGVVDENRQASKKVFDSWSWNRSNVEHGLFRETTMSKKVGSALAYKTMQCASKAQCACRLMVWWITSDGKTRKKM